MTRHKIFSKIIRNHFFLDCYYHRCWNVPNLTNRICNHQEQFCFAITISNVCLKSTHKEVSFLTEIPVLFPRPSYVCVLILFSKYLSKTKYIHSIRKTVNYFDQLIIEILSKRLRCPQPIYVNKCSTINCFHLHIVLVILWFKDSMQELGKVRLSLAARNFPYSELETRYAWFSCAKSSSRLPCLAWEAIY